MEKGLYTWGMGKYGDLGNGKEEKEITPYLVNLGKEEPVGISAGGYFTACVTSLGNVYSFGSNSHHRAGHPDTEDPIKVPRLVPGLKNIRKIACGDWHMVALADTGLCYSVGHNKAGALGMGHNSPVPAFTLVPKLEGIIAIAAGQNISMFIDKNQKLYSAGSSLLHGNPAKNNQLTPIPIEAFKSTNIVNIACGFVHCAAVDAEGKIYTWGSNTYFQLGHGNNKPVKVPKIVEALAGKFLVQASCTRSDKYCHTGCVDKDGYVYTWGSGSKGKLGHAATWTHADSADEKLPKRIEHLKDVKVKEIICAGLHSAVLTVDGILYTFGCGSDGRIGHPEYKGHKYLYKEPLPRIVDSFKGKTVEAVTSAYYHMIAIAY